MGEANKIIKMLKERNEAVKMKNGDAKHFSVEELRNFVESASVKLPQSTEVAFVYSGNLFPDGKGGLIDKSSEDGGMPRHYEILKKIADDSHGKVGIIDKTEASILMNDDEFKKSLLNAENVGTIKKRDAILYGAPAENGIRNPNSISDKISIRFIAENKNIHFLAMTHFSGADSIYAQSELPVFLMMKGGDVQGVPRGALQDVAEAYGHESVRHMIGASSFEQMGKLKIAIDGNNALVGYDSTKFWPEEFKHLGKRNIPDLPNVREIDFADVHKKLHPEQLKDLHKGVEDAKGTLKEAVHFPTLTKLGKNSGTVGGFVIGGLTSAFTLVAGGSKAEAAEVFYETAVPYGETQIDIAKGDAKAAARSATIETSSNIGSVGGMMVGAAIGSAVPIVGTVIGGAVGAVAGGLTAGSTTEFAIDNFGKAKDWLLSEGKYSKLDMQTAYQKLPSKMTHDMPPEVAALVEVKASQPLFARQFNELREQGSLSEVQDYIEKHSHQAVPLVDRSVNQPVQSYKTPTHSFAFQ